MEIYPVESGPVATVGYLITDGRSNEAMVIDAPIGSAPEFLSIAGSKKLKITKIALTHSHWDHFADSGELRRASGAKLYVHARDEYRMINPDAHMMFPIKLQIEAVTADEYIEHGSKIICGELEATALATPGHTEGGVSIYFPGDGVVFTGDTLFAGSIGRTDLPGGDLDQILRSIRSELLALPPETVVYPGHGEATTIDEEKKYNPFLTHNERP